MDMKEVLCDIFGTIQLVDQTINLHNDLKRKYQDYTAPTALPLETRGRKSSRPKDASPSVSLDDFMASRISQRDYQGTVWIIRKLDEVRDFFDSLEDRNVHSPLDAISSSLTLKRIKLEDFYRQAYPGRDLSTDIEEHKKVFTHKYLPSLANSNEYVI